MRRFTDCVSLTCPIDSVSLTRSINSVSLSYKRLHGSYIQWNSTLLLQFGISSIHWIWEWMAVKFQMNVMQHVLRKCLYLSDKSIAIIIMRCIRLAVLIKNRIFINNNRFAVIPLRVGTWKCSLIVLLNL